LDLEGWLRAHRRDVEGLSERKALKVLKDVKEKERRRQSSSKRAGRRAGKYENGKFDRRERGSDENNTNEIMKHHNVQRQAVTTTLLLRLLDNDEINLEPVACRFSDP
jgi:hypothetical protein